MDDSVGIWIGIALLAAAIAVFASARSTSKDPDATWLRTSMLLMFGAIAAILVTVGQLLLGRG